MVELHGWLTIIETYQNEDLIPQSELDAIMQQISDLIHTNTCGIKLQYANGTAFLNTLFCSNHRGEEVDEIIEIYTRISAIASGSYGVIYLRDDEDAMHHNAMQVYTFKRGRCIYQTDNCFSPCIPMVEDDTAEETPDSVKETQQICAIFAGGPERELPCEPVPAGAYILCADSGLRLAERLSLPPDLVLGDFDSLGEIPSALPYITAPAEKDDTDTMLAVRTALQKGFRDIRIYGAFGGRLDHTLANLQALEFIRRNGADGMLIGAGDCVRMLTDGERLRLPQRAERTLSLLSWSEQCSGVCVRGVYYPLEDAVLMRAFPLGVSNRITAPEAEIVCGCGMLLVVQSAG